MNENIDLIKILKDCPNEWNLWSPLFGEVKFNRIFCDYIQVIDKIGTQAYFDKSGKYITTYETIGCMLFPSKDQMEWSKFTAPWCKKDKLVEPKFKVGNWIITPTNNVLQITSIEGKSYKFNNKSHYWTICYCDEQCRFWTIQDAKDGDVLCCKSGWMCIFKTLNNHTNTFSSYCFMDSDKCFFNIGIDGHTLDKKFINAYNGEIYPATKEQRDLLFQKIKEAGYKWNVKTKTLDKLVKPKFDPNTLKPFDRILVRDHNDETWSCNLFSHIREVVVYKFTTITSSYKQCIPYNDETKHLAGTIEEAPEYYRYWED